MYVQLSVSWTVYVQLTVISLAPICRSTTTLFWEHFFRQSHTARDRQIKRKDSTIGLLGTSWLLQEQYASLHFHAMIGRQGSVVVRQIFIPGLNCTGGPPWFFFVFGGITGCGSASLKLCICKAASPWSQSSFPDSQWPVRCLGTCLQGVLLKSFFSKFLILSTGLPRRRSPPKIAARWRYRLPINNLTAHYIIQFCVSFNFCFAEEVWKCL